MSIAERIRKHIERLPEGEVFTPAKLLVFGSRAAVDQTLSRLAKEGAIMRVRRGVYIRPTESRFFGKQLPATEKIVYSFARLKGEKISLTPAEAARQLKLSTQVPMRQVFLWSGPTTSYKFGNTLVKFRHAGTEKVNFANTVAGKVLLALTYLGKSFATEEIFKSIEAEVSEEVWAEILKHLEFTPSWVCERIFSFTSIRKKCSLGEFALA